MSFLHLDYMYMYFVFSCEDVDLLTSSSYFTLVCTVPREPLHFAAHSIAALPNY